MSWVGSPWRSGHWNHHWWCCKVGKHGSTIGLGCRQVWQWHSTRDCPRSCWRTQSYQTGFMLQRYAVTFRRQRMSIQPTNKGSAWENPPNWPQSSGSIVAVSTAQPSSDSLHKLSKELIQLAGLYLTRPQKQVLQSQDAVSRPQKFCYSVLDKEFGYINITECLLGCLASSVWAATVLLVF